MLSKITLGGVELPKLTTMPKLDFEPVELYSKPSITGRLHNVYQLTPAYLEYGDYNSVRFNRKFSFEIISLTFEEWEALDAIDGTNCTLKFERDTYTEEYLGNLDCNFFKFDEHNYFDAVQIEFVVNIILLPSPDINYIVSNDTITMNVAYDADIYYTVNGGNPDDTSTLYENPIPFVPGVYRAIAKLSETYSSISTKIFLPKQPIISQNIDNNTIEMV